MIDPRHLSLHQWTDAVGLTLASSAPIPKLLSDDWKSWALAVISIPAINTFSPPNPILFNDWLEWAQRFGECVPL